MCQISKSSDGFTRRTGNNRKVDPTNIAKSGSAEGQTSTIVQPYVVRGAQCGGAAVSGGAGGFVRTKVSCVDKWLMGGDEWEELAMSMGMVVVWLMMALTLYRYL